MKSLVIAGLLFGSSLVYGQTCVGPAPCPEDIVWDDCSGPVFGPSPQCIPGWRPGPTVPPPPADLFPVGPTELCLGASGCFPVAYRVDGGFMLAESVLQNGYPVLGWSGPCFGSVDTCPDIGNQAWADLRLNALRIHRALRFSE